jgi:hypothetical protein
VTALEDRVRFIRALPHVKTPEPHVQCSMPVADPAGLPGWRRQRYRAVRRDPALCQMWSVAEIDGAPLCSRHAGAAALRILFDAQPGERE